MGERDEKVVRRDAAMWALVAEMEAMKTDRSAMEAFNQGNGGPGYDEQAFYGISKGLEVIAEKLREVAGDGPEEPLCKCGKPVHPGYPCEELES